MFGFFKKLQIREAEKFMDDCPAWARKCGVDSMALWKFCDRMIGHSWDERHAAMEKLELKQGNDRESSIAYRVFLRYEDMRPQVDRDVEAVCR